MASTNVLDSEKILKTGHLYKQGGSYRNWNQRYFILRRSTLNYYPFEGSKSPKGTIDLTTGRGVRTQDECRLKEGEWPSAAKPSLSFGLALESRTFYMYGSDQAAVDDWMTALHERIQKVGRPNSDYREDHPRKNESISSKIIHGGSRIFTRTPKHTTKTQADVNKERVDQDVDSVGSQGTMSDDDAIYQNEVTMNKVTES